MLRWGYGNDYLKCIGRVIDIGFKATGIQLPSNNKAASDSKCAIVARAITAMGLKVSSMH